MAAERECMSYDDVQRLYQQHIIKLIANQDSRNAKPEEREIIDWARAQMEK